MPVPTSTPTRDLSSFSYASGESCRNKNRHVARQSVCRFALTQTSTRTDHTHDMQVFLTSLSRPACLSAFFELTNV